MFSCVGRFDRFETPMSLINVNTSVRKDVLPWQISNVNSPSITFQRYFDDVVREKCPFSQVFVGKVKDALNLVNSDCVISEVTPLFSPFVKHIVHVFEDQLAAHVHKEGCELNTFSIMMTAQQEIAKKSLPDLIENLVRKSSKAVMSH